MRLLSRSEELVLVAIWRLGDNAYGVTIKDVISELTGHEWTLGAIYVPLDKLTQKDYVNKTATVPEARRGGRSKQVYTLTPSGKAALDEIRKIQQALYHGLDDEVFQSSGP